MDIVVTHWKSLRIVHTRHEWLARPVRARVHGGSEWVSLRSFQSWLGEFPANEHVQYCVINRHNRSRNHS